MAIAEGSVLLHVGMHKTGTTALQQMLYEVRAELAAQGVWYPDPGDPTTGVAHHWPARSLLQLSVGWGDAPPDPSAWAALAERAQDVTAPRAVVSSEYLSAATDGQCERIVADLSPRQVHVVVGVRNFASLAVSLWKQTLKKRRVSTLDDWLERNFRRPDPTVSTAFWDRHDPSAVAARWARLLGPERVAVVVLDERDASVLPRSFEQLLALRPGTLTSLPTTVVNRGMTSVEAELFRQLNGELKKRAVSWDAYRSVVRNGAIARVVDHRTPPSGEPRPRVPDWVGEQAAVEAERVAAAFHDAGVTIIGDLANLQPTPQKAPTEPGRITDAVPTDLAVDALVGAAVAAARRPARTSTASRAVTPTPNLSWAARLKRRLSAGRRQA